MSFYFEDEKPSSQQTTTLDDDIAFVCVNCGGTSSYHDSVTDALCCSSCFTQSQTQPNTEELDVEEIQALAARTRFGHVVGTTRHRRSGTGVAKERKPLEEFDSSMPFPSLITCLHGMQQVLKHCIECVTDLVGLESSQQLEENVKGLWMSYLRAWTDGAEFYGKLHPEIRFSLRDYFLPPAFKTKVMKNLSHRAAQTVRKELATQEEKKNDLLSSSGRLRDEHSDLSKRHLRSISHFSQTYHQPTSLMWMYWDKGKRGRLEAALTTVPSMRLVACLLWLPISPMGVTLHQVLVWIANGSIPLQNAFEHCLSKEEQAALANVSSFFRLSKLPPVSEMETLAKKVMVACGLKSLSHLHGQARSRETNGDNGQESPASRQGSKERPELSFVIPQSVPLLTARLIDDLGFPQQILHRSLALMGVLREAPPNLWLPAPLEASRPVHLLSTAHVLAVIVVACKMTPGWETWTYPPSLTSHSGKDGVKSPSWETERESKRRRTESIKNRFVPYNEESFRFVSNGAQMEGYLDYLEETILDETKAIFPKFRSILDETNNAEQEDETLSDCSDDEMVVQRQQGLMDSKAPFGNHKNVWRRQKFHNWNLRLRKKGARWADANGLGEYVVYTDPGNRGARAVPTLEPFHPQYGLLIEYISHKTSVKPAHIHAAVAVLDEEVLRLVRPQEAKATTAHRSMVAKKRATINGEDKPLPCHEVDIDADEQPEATADV